jgi:hypothetical protein
MLHLPIDGTGPTLPPYLGRPLDWGHRAETGHSFNASLKPTAGREEPGAEAYFPESWRRLLPARAPLEPGPANDMATDRGQISAQTIEIPFV